ncbi:MAG: hypothetical protein HGA80_01405 [Candidatus Omnitrophica bacterium]|nr:hypothetical protein [Candidatus Omnitrophota bacterium]
MSVLYACLLGGLILFWCPPVYARTDIPFEGTVDLRQESLALRVGNGDADAVRVDMRRAAKDALEFSVDLRHVRLPFFELSSVLQGRVSLSSNAQHRREAAGEIRSHYTLVNQKPVRDLYFKFAVRDRKLFIERLWAGALSVSGYIDLQEEHRSSLAMEIVSSDLEHICGLFQSVRTVHTPSVSGTLTGALTLTGPLASPLLKGRLAAYNGCFNALCYESILLQMEGTLPNIRLDDSVVTHADGFSFNLAGAVDLSDMAHMQAQIRQLGKVPVVSAARDKREWILKRQRSDSNRDAVTEMKYILLKDASGDSEGVLGFEHKIGF